MIYKLTAKSDIKYRLKEAPSPKEGYAVAKGAHIFITADVLKLLVVSDGSGKRRLDSKAYTLERHDAPQAGH
jgi:hypothetical protein